MHHVLVVSLSSLGDTVRSLPVLHDIHRHFPDTEIDLLTNADGLGFLQNNPIVKRVHGIDTFKWRLRHLTRWRAYWKALRQRFEGTEFDFVVDLHGTWAGMMTARAIAGKCHGPSLSHARHSWVSFFYNRRAGWDMQSHAVEAQRELVANLLDYPLVGAPHFLIERQKKHLPIRRHGEIWFITSAANPHKVWPVSAWRELAHRFSDLGFKIVLPYQGAAAAAVTATISKGISGVEQLPSLSLNELEAKMKEAVLVVGLDTGLTHLAAAHYLPLVAIFNVTPAWRFAPRFNPYAITLGDIGQEPTAGEVAAASLRLLRGNKL